ncbi:CoA ester lyase [Bosea sp. Tri-44]|uniref:HpcH/HpaI aldolase/citrate lyase family protein n=1 Tax=Bosea sp. Tri-44 TaxID=1972137 RepID=UPI00100EC4AC|nr:CoA ester lyase [Bosea sp. Tri-44]RXT56372.1 CoA ester lyase [Bosea sp. Tri-44]
MQPPVSYLFVPGNRPERFDKAVSACPGAVILDLEDSVHPDSKASARTAISAWHEGTPSSACLRYIRLNGNTVAGLKQDLDWLTGLGASERCAGIMLPKVESAEVLVHVAERLASWNSAAHVVAIIETAKGLHGVDRIAPAPRVARLAFGSLDFSLDTQCQHTNEAFLLARSRIVLASRVAGLPAPIDGVTPAFKEAETLLADAAHARSLGFAAKLCIHPAQVAPVERAFQPSRETLDWAQRVIDAAASGNHAIQVDGAMVDLPLIEVARKVLQQDALPVPH